jgi:hypothetical protein
MRSVTLVKPALRAVHLPVLLQVEAVQESIDPGKDRPVDRKRRIQGQSAGKLGTGKLDLPVEEPPLEGDLPFPQAHPLKLIAQVAIGERRKVTIRRERRISVVSWVFVQSHRAGAYPTAVETSCRA